MLRTPTGCFPRRLLIALGGNAIHPAGILGTGEEQFEVAARASQALAPIMREVPELIITHGNGPGVGKVLMRQAIARKRVVSMPLDICVANSQGGISYVIMQCLQNTLKENGIKRAVSSLICEVEVDPDDRAFTRPDKPLGYFFTQSEAKELAREFGWVMREDAGRGWRMVVPSPKPLKVLNSEILKELISRGTIVITAGGGGIPVKGDAGGRLSGLEAVIDKDLTSALLAKELGIDHLLILTSVHNVSINYGTDRQQPLQTVSLADLESYQKDGQFAAGSMAPKIEAVVNFLKNGGQRAIIAHLDDACAALSGKVGTQVMQ